MDLNFNKTFSSFVTPFFSRNFTAFVYVARSMRSFSGPVYRKSRGQTAEAGACWWTGGLNRTLSRSFLQYSQFPLRTGDFFPSPSLRFRLKVEKIITVPFLPSGLFSRSFCPILEEVLFFDWRNISVVVAAVRQVFLWSRSVLVNSWHLRWPGEVSLVTSLPGLLEKGKSPRRKLLVKSWFH